MSDRDADHMLTELQEARAEIDRLSKLVPSQNVKPDPKHYQGRSGMSCADFIRDVIGAGGMENFWRGNALKYIYRAGSKGGREKFKDDIAKAIDCLQRLLAESEQPNH